MTTNKIELTFTQCKQIAENGDLREFVEQVNDQPEWMKIDYLSTIHAVNQGGCESGAYMDAVTYHIARQVMNDCGDDVLDYIENQLGELPNVSGESWSGMACKYLSCAVELWCSQFANILDGVDWD